MTISKKKEKAMEAFARWTKFVQQKKTRKSVSRLTNSEMHNSLIPKCNKIKFKNAQNKVRELERVPSSQLF